jgi:hypothetical protein
LKSIELNETKNVLKKYRQNVEGKTVKLIEGGDDGETIRKGLYLPSEKECPFLYVLYFPLNDHLLEIVYAVNLNPESVESLADNFEEFLRSLSKELAEEFEKFRQKLQSEEEQEPPNERKQLPLTKLEHISKEGIVLEYIQQELQRTGFNSLFLVQRGRIIPIIEAQNQIELVYKITPSQYKLMNSNIRRFLDDLSVFEKECSQIQDVEDSLNRDSIWIKLLDQLHTNLCEQFLNKSACDAEKHYIARALFFSTAVLRRANPEYTLSSEPPEVFKKILTDIEKEINERINEWVKEKNIENLYKANPELILKRWRIANKTFRDFQQEHNHIGESLINLLAAIILNDEVEILQSTHQEGIGASIARAVADSRIVFPQIIRKWRKDPRVAIFGPQDVFAIESVHIRQSSGKELLKDALYLPV